MSHPFRPIHENGKQIAFSHGIHCENRECVARDWMWVHLNWPERDSCGIHLVHVYEGFKDRGKNHRSLYR
jgi:hypothetical protein